MISSTMTQSYKQLKKEREKNTTDKTPIAQGILSKAKETLKNGTQLHQCQ